MLYSMAQLALYGTLPHSGGILNALFFFMFFLTFFFLLILSVGAEAKDTKNVKKIKQTCSELLICLLL